MVTIQNSNLPIMFKPKIFELKLFYHKPYRRSRFDDSWFFSFYRVYNDV